MIETLIWLAGELLYWLVVLLTWGRYGRQCDVPRVQWGDAGLKDEHPPKG
jgi:hypothetical protein